LNEIALLFAGAAIVLLYQSGQHFIKNGFPALLAAPIVKIRQ